MTTDDGDTAHFRKKTFPGVIWCAQCHGEEYILTESDLSILMIRWVQTGCLPMEWVAG
ncbi:hypothetical protein [Aeromonas phage Aer_P220]|uniref:Uncharacterized protein n=1 Tax=Aeromonas phage Aer_P220 TaxID=2951227 RepID=A0A9E7T2E7_9CAUD|nr:hypothetical protein [Aeromonas phage Aer_P220]